MGQISDYDKWLYDQVDKYMEEQDMKCCENCIHYINGYCWKDVKHLDPAYLVPDRDSKDPDDSCDDWEYNEMEE